MRIARHYARSLSYLSRRAGVRGNDEITGEIDSGKKLEASPLAQMESCQARFMNVGVKKVRTDVSVSFLQL